MSSLRPRGDRGRKGFDTQGTDIGPERRSGERRKVLLPGAKVAIVGGGSCGVYTCKTLLEAGLVPTVFEQSHGVGGVWKSTGRGGVAYDVLRTNSSNLITTAPDFPMQPTTSPFPHHSEIRSYIESYARHFDLNRHIRFNTEVRSVAPILSNSSNQCPKWKVSVRRHESDAGLLWDDAYHTTPVEGSDEEIIFDAVFLCTGQYGGGGVWPELPGHNRFAGTITHSQTYRTNQAYAGKHVVIIGIGNSALDLALDTSAVAESVLVSVRRSTSFIVAVDDELGRPADVFLHTRFNIYGPKGQSTSPFEEKQNPSAPLALDTIAEKGDPSAVVKAMIRAGLAPPKTGAKSQLGQVKDRKSVLDRLRDGRIRFGPGIQEVRERSIILTDGREVPADAIICCTGYDLIKGLNFVDPAVLEPVQRLSPSGRPWLDLYKMLMHPTHRTLVFCGMITTDANEALVGEMQARWATSVLMGLADWPSDEDVNEFCCKRAERIDAVDPAYTRFVRYIHYMDDLARDIGCLPKLPPLPDAWRSGPEYVTTPKTDADRFAFNLWFGPTVPTHWRLDGPGAWNSEEARTYVVNKLIPGVKTPVPDVPISWAIPSKL